MNISVGGYKNPPNTVDKDFVVFATVNGKFRENSPVTDPVFILDKTQTDLTDNEWGSINYVYAPDFMRYYFVTQLEYVSTNLIAIHCHVDVLMSYKASIRQWYGIVQRNEFEYNLYLDDGLFRSYQNSKHKLQKFPHSMNDFSYILALGGNGELS